MKTLDDLTDAIHDMLETFDPDDSTHLSTSAREFEPVNPEARKARMMTEITPDLAKNAVCASFVARFVMDQNVDPRDISRMAFNHFYVEPIMEDDEITVISEGRWVVSFGAEFRPTNGWEPA